MEINDEKFPLLVFRKGDLFYGIIKELRIIESDESLSELYKKSQQRKNEVLTRFQKVHLEGLLLSESPAPKKRFALIHFVILVGFLMIPIVSLTKPVGMLLYRCADLMKGSWPQKIISFNESLQTMPAERKEEIRKALHDIFIEIKPFSNEVTTVWNDQTLPAAQRIAK